MVLTLSERQWLGMGLFLKKDPTMKCFQGTQWQRYHRLQMKECKHVYQAKHNRDQGNRGNLIREVDYNPKVAKDIKRPLDISRGKHKDNSC